jgi:ligand-binding SRPBCC domain-containing protein
MNTLQLTTRVAVPAPTLWAAQSMATVNHELGPWIQMTVPPAWRGRRLVEWPGSAGPGAGPAGLFSSWVLLLGLLPLDRHAFGTLALQPLRFVESSSSWLLRAWQHERVVHAVPGGCEVTDRITYQPRLGLMAPLLGAIYGLVFRHRHARLARQYGRLAAPGA